ncbi:hypothetical protein ACHAW5_003829 [Stephanodiscus triporus]|uniref:Uncharacterized protein n=1 Tax=Stephanodiscus triporus TaxID=2934178 RepID=A0ABD3QZE6_9STRA
MAEVSQSDTLDVLVGRSSMSMTPVLVRSYRIFSSAFPHFFTFGSGGIGGGPGCLVVGGCAGAVDPKTFRKWVWSFIRAIAELEDELSALRYELGVSILGGPGERVEADEGYAGHPDKIVCPTNPGYSDERRAMSARGGGGPSARRVALSFDRSSSSLCGRRTTTTTTAAAGAGVVGLLDNASEASSSAAAGPAAEEEVRRASSSSVVVAILEEAIDGLLEGRRASREARRAMATEEEREADDDDDNEEDGNDDELRDDEGDDDNLDYDFLS